MANQLYKSHSIYIKDLQLGNIYFFKNSILDLIIEKIKYLAIIVILFNQFIQENKLLIAGNKINKSSFRLSNNIIALDTRKINPQINEFFF